MPRGSARCHTPLAWPRLDRERTDAPTARASTTDTTVHHPAQGGDTVRAPDCQLGSLPEVRLEVRLERSWSTVPSSGDGTVEVAYRIMPRLSQTALRLTGRRCDVSHPLALRCERQDGCAPFLCPRAAPRSRPGTPSTPAVGRLDRRTTAVGPERKPSSVVHVRRECRHPGRSNRRCLPSPVRGRFGPTRPGGTPRR
jgi:hypothetical protein